MRQFRFGFVVFVALMVLVSSMAYGQEKEVPPDFQMGELAFIPSTSKPRVDISIAVAVEKYEGELGNHYVGFGHQAIRARIGKYPLYLDTEYDSAWYNTTYPGKVVGLIQFTVAESAYAFKDVVPVFKNGDEIHLYNEVDILLGTIKLDLSKPKLCSVTYSYQGVLTGWRSKGLVNIVRHLAPLASTDLDRVELEVRESHGKTCTAWLRSDRPFELRNEEFGAYFQYKGSVVTDNFGDNIDYESMFRTLVAVVKVQLRTDHQLWHFWDEPWWPKEPAKAIANMIWSEDRMASFIIHKDWSSNGRQVVFDTRKYRYTFVAFKATEYVEDRLAIWRRPIGTTGPENLITMGDSGLWSQCDFAIFPSGSEIWADERIIYRSERTDSSDKEIAGFCQGEYMDSLQDFMTNWQR